MSDDLITEGMLDMFIFETEQGLENLENICLDSKDAGAFDEDNVNEIFRIMHTIKGASAVMMYQNIKLKTGWSLMAIQQSLLRGLQYSLTRYREMSQVKQLSLYRKRRCRKHHIFILHLLHLKTAGFTAYLLPI